MQSSWKRNLGDWVVPPKVQALLRALRHKTGGDVLDPELSATLAPSRELIDCHTGARCFILGTGPSIRNQDLGSLASETCIAVSNFLVHKDFGRIQPRYYCLAPFHPPISEVGWHQLMKELDSATEYGPVFLFPEQDRKRNLKSGTFAARKVLFLALGGSWESLRAAQGPSPLSRLPNAQSVTVFALMAALIMGFREIYLLGCDHDWILHLGESRHFYEEERSAMVRHGYDEWSGHDLLAQFRGYVRLWEQYEVLKSVAEARGTRILNATEGGLLDVFPRVSLASAVAGKQQ